MDLILEMQHASHSSALDMHVWESQKTMPAVWTYGPGKATEIQTVNRCNLERNVSNVLESDKRGCGFQTRPSKSATFPSTPRASLMWKLLVMEECFNLHFPITHTNGTETCASMY